jgi:hypothetical protein
MALEARLLDQYGNQFGGSHDAVGDEIFTETGRVYTKTIGALNSEVIIDLNGQAIATFDLRTAAMNATLVFEGSVDGVNYISLPGFDMQTEAYISSVIVTTTLAKIYTVGVSGLRRVRVRVSAFTSGNIDVSARASRADVVIYGRLVPANLWITAVGAANAAVTLTIPAAGAGLFHYITGAWIGRAGAAALAGTAVLTITTTNWPGTAAFSVGNASPAGGTQRDIELVLSNPIKSLVANTATTIVMPVPGAGVLWRANVSYYAGA